MNRRQVPHLGAVIIAAIFLRALLFNYVGIWGDYGFYIYDSRLILQGGDPFVDFLGRSPLFNYAFAWARSVFGHPIPLLRIFISVFWLATIVPVYLFARRVVDHQTGIAAALVMGLTPFGLVYGMWANTQSLAALLSMTAVYALVRTERPAWSVAVGVLFGLAYLSRRSVFVIAGAAGLYLGWRWWQDNQSLRWLATRWSGIIAGFALALGLMYGAMVGFDLGRAYALFEVHTINLLFSYGRGGYPLITVDAPIVTNSVDSGRIPIFNDLCQVCGVWTARTFAKTLIVALPAVGLLTAYFRDITWRYFDPSGLEYLFGVLAVLGAYAFVAAGLAGYPVRMLTVPALAGFVVVAYKADRITPKILYDRDLQLVLAVLSALAVGYLYRNRVLHTYYFMDFWPYLSIAAGIAAVGMWRRAERPIRMVLIGTIVLSVFVSTGGAHPLTNVVLDDNDDSWFTMDNIHEIRDDINQRTEPGDTVITTSPAYLADTHAKTLNDNPRIHMVLVRYENSGPAVPLYADLIRAMDSGSAEYVIMSRTMRNILRWNDTARKTFFQHYCRVENAIALYQRAGGVLYQYQPRNCSCANQPTMDTDFSDGVDEVNQFDQVRRHEEPLYSPAKSDGECPEAVL